MKCPNRFCAVAIVLLDLCACGPAKMQTSAQPEELAIPAGRMVKTDGRIDSEEWSDAGRVTIEVDAGWRVTVLHKTDGANLYFAFENMKSGGQELFPEVLIDVNQDRTPEWDENDWWLHASYNDCEGQGRYNVWDCSETKSGWAANNFPLERPGVVEIQVSYAKIGLDPGVAAKIGLAFDLTDTVNQYYFWPPKARIDRPESWAIAVLSE